MTTALSFILGLTSTITQIIFLRELIVVLYGNEITYALILASWLFWVGLGSYICSSLARKIKNYLMAINLVQLIIVLILPVVLILIRIIKNILGIYPGEIIGINTIGFIAFIVIAPVGFLFGAFYSLICSCSKEKEGGERKIAQIYTFESLGSAIGGFVFSVILIPFISALNLTLILSGINLLIIILFGRNKKINVLSLCVVILLSMIMLKSSNIDERIRDWQWKGLNVIDSRDTIYGNLTLVESSGRYSLYENGMLSFTTGDELSSEESMHYSLLEHPNPKNILLIGNGLGGSLEEILKYKEIKVDYVELDPGIIDFAIKNLPPDVLEPLNDPRVNVIHADARLVIKKSQDKYDVVVVNVGDPKTALSNRYYTLEFFNELKSKLNLPGIISLTVSSNENYLTEEANQFLRSINSTLKAAFSDVISIPGETNIFIASNKKNILTLSAEELIGTLKGRGIRNNYVNEYYIPFKLSETRLAYNQKVLEEKGEINSDNKPITYLFNTILWSTHFGEKAIQTVYKTLDRRYVYLLLIPLLIFIFAFVQRRKIAHLPVRISILTTGFSEIIFQIIVILAFQSLYGYAYYKIGFIISSFMLGLVGGSLYAERLIASGRNLFKKYYLAQFGIFIYPLLLPVLFVVFRDTAFTLKYPIIFSSVFAFLPVIAGFIGGVQYPLAVHLMRTVKNSDQSKDAGILYALDVLGSSVGAFIAATVIIPLFGINGMAVLCAVVNLTVLIILRIYPNNLSVRT